MSYEMCLKIAGAEILAYESFGSYQGDWIAKVVYKGKTLWILGSFGSCNGCDAFESEFEDDSHNCIEMKDEYYNPMDTGNFQDNCRECQILKKRAIEFGKNYLDNPITHQALVKKFKDDGEWDMEADGVGRWLGEHKDNALKRLQSRYGKK